VANCWRTTSDIDNNWQSIVQRAVLNDNFAHAAEPGAFNDPDVGGSGIMLSLCVALAGAVVRRSRIIKLAFARHS